MCDSEKSFLIFILRSLQCADIKTKFRYMSSTKCVSIDFHEDKRKVETLCSHVEPIYDDIIMSKLILRLTDLPLKDIQSF